MQVIITMAGESKRFSKQGFTRPKYELYLMDKTMFSWALLSLHSWFKEYPFTFVARQGSRHFIAQSCEELCIKHYQVIELKQFTQGQASTVLTIQNDLLAEQPILIYNIDTHVSSNALTPQMIPATSTGWLPVFPAQGEHWSFVHVGDNQRALAVKEKEVISPWGTIGLYYFSTLSLFAQSFAAVYLTQFAAQHNETYIAPLYQHLIDNQQAVNVSFLKTTNVTPLGTPDEALAFDPHFYERNKKCIKEIEH